MSDIQPGIVGTPAPKKSRKKLWILVGVLALIIIALSSMSNKSSNASATAPTTVAPTSTVAPATSTTFSPVQQWAGAHSGLFGALGADMGNVGAQIKQDTTTGDYTTASLACAKLGEDAKAGAALPPIPNATLEQQFAQMLTNLQQGSTSCVSGISNNDINEIS
ncbi:MAG: hypothetical protein HKL81_02440 [Acidimicrobiaceae bacterium]|nr:hypothetical protein [Acidimicrobiaceae bacterium]